jgi:serine protease inhibitor ecotin
MNSVSELQSLKMAEAPDSPALPPPPPGISISAPPPPPQPTTTDAAMDLAMPLPPAPPAAPESTAPPPPLPDSSALPPPPPGINISAPPPPPPTTTDAAMDSATPPPSVSKKRKFGSPNQMTGLIGVHKSGGKYEALITYGGTQQYLGSFDTKEQAGIAYDQVAIDKSTEEVSYRLNYPKTSDHESEEEEAPPKKKRKRSTPNQTTGLIGVSNDGKTYIAVIVIDGTQYNLGTFATKDEAGMAYDRFVADKSTEEIFFALNSKKQLANKKKVHGKPNKKSGLIGVVSVGKKYNVMCWYGGKQTYLGRFDTKEQAGIAYDQFVVDKSTETISYALNYPNMSDLEREEALTRIKGSPRQRGSPNQTTGLIGVSKKGEKYVTRIAYGGKQHHLGRFDTREHAGMAYDRFVVDKNTDEVSFRLNYPNMSDLERDEALPVEPPSTKKRNRGNDKAEFFKSLTGIFFY